MDERQDLGAVVAKWILGGILELVAISIVISFAFSLINSASTALFLLGIVLLALLVSGIAYQILHFFQPPVIKTGQSKASKLAAYTASQRRMPGEFIREDGVEIFVPRGQAPFADDDSTKVDA
jgi:hypothetical protein